MKIFSSTSEITNIVYGCEIIEKHCLPGHIFTLVHFEIPCTGSCHLQHLAREIVWVVAHIHSAALCYAVGNSFEDVTAWGEASRGKRLLIENVLPCR